MLGYVLISLIGANEKKVHSELMELEQVKEAHILFGEWDLIAKVECKNPEELAAFVMDNIRSMQEVKLSSTLIVAK